MVRLVILAVEDQALLRFNAVDLLEDAGYVVMEAANADEAILILDQKQHSAPIYLNSLT